MGILKNSTASQSFHHPQYGGAFPSATGFAIPQNFYTQTLPNQTYSQPPLSYQYNSQPSAYPQYGVSQTTMSLPPVPSSYNGRQIIKVRPTKSEWVTDPTTGYEYKLAPQKLTKTSTGVPIQSRWSRWQESRRREKVEKEEKSREDDLRVREEGPTTIPEAFKWWVISKFQTDERIEPEDATREAAEQWLGYIGTSIVDAADWAYDWVTWGLGTGNYAPISTRRSVNGSARSNSRASSVNSGRSSGFLSRNSNAQSRSRSTFANASRRSRSTPRSSHFSRSGEGLSNQRSTGGSLAQARASRPARPPPARNVRSRW
jgi:hypothetical protein